MIDFLYAQYLTSMRGQNTDHICKRNVVRVKTDRGDRTIDGECRCQHDTREVHGPRLYSAAEHRDEWRMMDQPIGEDFPGEYRVVAAVQNIVGLAARE